LLDTNLCVQKITKKKNKNKYNACLSGLNIQKRVIPGPVLAVICGLGKQNICEVKV
jgi:hypothetical protein